MLYLRTGEKYKVKNIIKQDSTISYEHYYHKKNDSSNYEILRSDITSIKYADGKKEVLVNDSTPRISHKKIEQYLSRKNEPLGLMASGAMLLTIGAFISLVILGGAGFFTILFGLAALVLGILSLRRIRRQPEKYKGRFFAFLGMIPVIAILTYLVMIMIYFIFFF